MNLKSKRKHSHKEAGFTLIEMMSSMVILAIGVVAIIAMQKSSLDTYAANRDIQIAGGLADQFLEMLQVSSLRWKGNSRASMTYLNNTASYKISTTATQVWNRYTPRPVNFEMRTPPTTGADPRYRFCIYFSYNWAGTPAGVSTFRDQLMEVDVTVLVPRNTGGASNTLAGCRNAATLFQSCSTRLMVDSSCSIAARRTLFRRLSRTSMVRQNLSGI